MIFRIDPPSTTINYEQSMNDCSECGKAIKTTCAEPLCPECQDPCAKCNKPIACYCCSVLDYELNTLVHITCFQPLHNPSVILTVNELIEPEDEYNNKMYVVPEKVFHSNFHWISENVVVENDVGVRDWIGDYGMTLGGAPKGVSVIGFYEWDTTFDEEK